MSAAEALSAYESRLPKATPEQRAREHLLRELNARVVEIAFLNDGWDGRGSKRPSMEVLQRASELGLMIVGSTFPSPNKLNMGASADGFVQFSLFGQQGREADLWVEDGSGEFAYVASRGAEDYEGRMPIASYMRFAAWLAGDTKTP